MVLGDGAVIGKGMPGVVFLAVMIGAGMPWVTSGSVSRGVTTGAIVLGIILVGTEVLRIVRNSHHRCRDLWKHFRSG